MPAVVFRRVTLAGRVTDVLVRDGVVVAVGDRSAWPRGVGTSASRPGTQVVDGRGHALLPGLHDHHVHLLAAAAELSSVSVAPADVRDRGGLASTLAAAQPVGGWIRAVGYDEAVAGPLDAASLDRLRPDVPVRVQHRSGALWVLNGRAAEMLRLDASTEAGVERDADGSPTGRLWRLDPWLRDRLRDAGAAAGVDLGAIGAQLVRSGVTGVTDASPDLDATALGELAAAQRTGALPQKLTTLSAAQNVPRGIDIGPRKIVLADHDLPHWDQLRRLVGRSRDRGVALHSVTRESLVLAAAVLRDVGTRPADRIEHAAVLPDELLPLLAELGVTVVTQPAMAMARGDDYLARIDQAEHADLWRFASLYDAGIPVGMSSDAPYGPLDPWTAIRSARDRTTPSGVVLGPRERVSTARALAGYLSDPARPGGPVRAVRPGTAADLVLLDVPLPEMLEDPDAGHVRLTFVGGRLVHERS